MTVLARLTEPIRLKIGAANPCQAASCDVPMAARVAFLGPGWQTLETRGVCTGHALALRAEGGCLVLPLRGGPTPEQMLAAVNAELARRRPQPAFNVFGFNATGGSFTFTSTFG